MKICVRSVLFSVLAILAACGVDEGPVDAPAPSVEAEREVSDDPASFDALPESVQETVRRNAMADVHRLRKVERVDALGLDDVWRASNRPQHIEAVFAPDRMHARRTGKQDFEFSLAATSWGRHDALNKVGEATIEASDTRLEYRREGFTEWYINGDDGIEHGFDIAEKPAGDGPLRVEVEVGGELSPRLKSDDTVMLMSSAGEHVLRYSGLIVEDAKGTTLAAHFEVEDDTIAIVVDDRDAAYPIVIDPWVQQAKLTASDAAAGDEFGYSVAASGSTIVVGAPFNDDGGTDSGAAYVFEDSGSGFVQTAKLIANDAAPFDQFGYSLAVSGSTIVVAARYDDDGGSSSGSAYVFEDSGGGFMQTEKLTASDAAASDQFGESVALSGSTIVVGAMLEDDGGNNAGSAYVFQDSGSGFVQTQKLTAGDASANDWFGNSVGVSGSTIVVGSISDDDAGLSSGSAYVFEGSGRGFVQAQKLTASDATALDRFGRSVGVSGSTIVVGAFSDDGAGLRSGSAYVFEDRGSGFNETTKLTASDAAADDRFGFSVTVSGSTIVVGAYRDDDGGDDSGSVYVFEDSGNGFVQTTKLTASDAAAGDQFGWSVGVSGSTIVVGANEDDDDGSNSGSAYVFEFNTPPVATDYLRATSDQISSNEDMAETITLEGVDADGDAVTFEILTDPANGTLSITSADGAQAGTFNGIDTTTVAVTYTPTSETMTTDTFTYRVDNGRGGTDDATVEIDITLANDAPSITSTALSAATEDVEYSHTAAATDPEGDTLTWAVTSTDTCGGTFTGSTYTFTPAGPTPPADCVVAIEVCDDGTPSECDTQSTTVTITAVNGAPSITSTLSMTATEDVAYSYAAAATDPEGDTLTWGVVAGTDTCGGSFTGNTYTFTPAGPVPDANCEVAVEVCDTNLDCDTQSATVAIASVNDAPTITSTVPTTATEEVEYSFTATANDPEGDTLTWSVAGADTCGGSFAGSTYAFTPAGPTPPADCVVAIDVCDDGTPSECDTQSTTVTITSVNEAPVFVAPTPADMATLQVIEGDTLTFTVAADDPEGDTLTYAVHPLPMGATVDAATGDFAWTPTWEDAGTYAITLEASDGEVIIERDVTVEVSFLDEDSDGLPDTWEVANGLDPTTRDSDGDIIDDLEEVGDIFDARDTDSNGTLDAVDLDSDGDGIPDADEAGDDDLDTPPVDTDGDSTPDYRDLDSDGDGVDDDLDNCRLVENANQTDTDGNGIGDACDGDLDGDGVDDDADEEDDDQNDEDEDPINVANGGTSDDGCGCSANDSNPANVVLAALILGFLSLRRLRSRRGRS